MNDIKSAIVKPELQALLIADHVYRDHDSGKHIVAGIFDRTYVVKQQAQSGVSENIEAPETAKNKQDVSRFQRAGSPYVYINLREIQGTHKLFLRLVSLKDEAILMKGEIQISHDDLLTSCEVAVPCPPLPGQKGVYAMELLWHNEEPLGSVRIVVKEMAEGEYQ